MSLNENHNEKNAQSLKKSFENWDAGHPGDSLWNKLNADLDNSNSIQRSFDQWDNEAPSAALWDKLDQSLNAEVELTRTPSENPRTIEAAYNEWSVDEPNDLWSKLDTELSTAKVWEELSESLDDESETFIDEKFRARYEVWSTGTNHDGWSKLDDALSRERVWNRLAVSLKQPVGLQSTWWKYAASFIAFSFLSIFVNDGVNSDNLFAITSTTEREILEPNSTDNKAVTPNTAKNNDANRNVAFTHTPLQQLNNLNNNQNSANSVVLNTENSANQEQNLANRTFVNNSTEVNRTVDGTNNSVTNFDLASLENRGFPETDNCSNVRQIHFKNTPRSYLTYTLGVGTLLSQSTNSERSSLSSSAPRLGFAVDATVSRHFGHWGLTQNFGLAQLTQENGDYVRGRYQNSIQKLNTIQATSGVFYSFNRMDVNAGVVFTRILNGLEQENNKIINVYNTNKIQTGISAGVTYNFSPHRDKIRYGIGAQYQWTPTIHAGNTEFRDLQGIKILGKISF